MSLTELHTHLYGCLQPDDLRWLYHRKVPRPHIYINSYREYYGHDPEFHELFHDDSDARAKLERSYYFDHPDNFQAFQIRFNLIISVAHADPEELPAVCDRVLAHEPAGYVEYRMLYPPRDRVEYQEMVLATCEGLRTAERTHTGKQARVAVSLFRDDRVCRQSYEWLREVLEAHTVARQYVCAIDFCAQEEGYPPAEKKDFVQEVLRSNRDNPGALAVLYHVGESYTDKSVESAARWIVEAARMGAHRLGHCVAMGVRPELYAGQTGREIVRERRDQIAFELEHYDELRQVGIEVDADLLQREAKLLAEKSPGDTVTYVYDPQRVDRLRQFQDWCMRAVGATGAIIESCPTSNLLIANLRSPDNHPLHRFLEADLPVVIGADDPGILNTNLEREFQQIESWEGISEEKIAAMQSLAEKSKSDLLTGKTNAPG
ncbi:MAG: hypothetical protein KDK27_05275 [Leptospiraceae bacterium]|nr:hypothetical protein [Leptospiraceae bacterium]